ncbi:hypothetical protein MHYP_G00199640 [Metynnis hypsauchen]
MGQCTQVRYKPGEGLIKQSSVSEAKRLPSHSVSPYQSVCLPPMPIHRLPTPLSMARSVPHCLPASSRASLPLTVAPPRCFAGSQIIRIKSSVKETFVFPCLSSPP